MITLTQLLHRGKVCVAIRGRIGREADAVIRSFPGRAYSKTHGCWYIEYSDEALRALRMSLEAVVPVAVSDNIGRTPGSTAGCEADAVAVPLLFPETLRKLQYSPHTRANYCSAFKKFLAFIAPAGVDDFDEKDVHRYLLHLADAGFSTSSQNIAINALKFYLEQVKKGPRQVFPIERPRKALQLPSVLSESEVKDLLWATSNLKHRCIMFMLYASGLRVSELLNLKKNEVDFDRKVVMVKGGKGKKDRITLLSAIAAEYLEYYIELYRPEEWMFEGVDKKQYSATSVNKLIHYNARKAGIEKRVSAHTLRHSFATHLLEHGTDLRYIQALLGHESSRTTERYAHVSTRAVERLVSPLDSLISKTGRPEDKDKADI